MNQVINKVPYGLLSKEDRAQFSREAKGRGMYELYDTRGQWGESGYVIGFNKTMVYRLIIKDDEWYYWENSCGYSDTQKGGSLNGKTVKFLSTLRPATPAEIQATKPKVESLEDRVKAEYGDYEVAMLTVKDGAGWLSYDFSGMNRVCHITAQSDPRFQGYVYIHSENDWLVSNKPTKSSRNKYIQPFAVLFTKDNN